MLCFGVVGATMAQNNKAPNFKEGLIKYQIEVDGAPEVSQFANSSIINLYLKGKNSKMDIGIMAGMANFQFINNKKDNLMTLLMDVPTFYEKTAIDIDENSDIFKELSAASNQNQAPEKNVEIKYFKNKKKRIAKYSCYRAEVDLGTGTGEKLIVYLTDKLRPEVMPQVDKSLNNLNGFPLGFEVEIEGVVVKIMATEVLKQSVESEKFNVPDSYQKKTLDEFKDEIQKKFGGMGNGSTKL